MSTLDELFAKKECEKLTENGDAAYNKVSVSDNLLNLLFMTEYYSKNLSKVKIGSTERDKLFARFIRDPRFGIGKRDLGRVLMHKSKCTFDEIVRSGRYDDLFIGTKGVSAKLAGFLKKEIENGNELAKKWMPRYSSKNLLLARQFAAIWGMNKQQYGKFVKCNTTEQKLSRKKTEDIKFEQVPSLAMIKYYNRFKEGEDTKYRFMEYLAKVHKGEAKLNISTTNVYDIYRNRERIDADLFFDKIEKVSGSWLPIVDTSGSMYCTGANDAAGKALAIGHYLAKCSSYAPNKVVSFSSNPKLITLGRGERVTGRTQYMREIESMYTGDCSNTDFGAVMDLLSGLTDVPKYLVVLSDMEFDYGSSMSKEATMKLFKERGYDTKIVWWNLNARDTTSPELSDNPLQSDEYGNIFLSGYNPMLLKFLQTGFDGGAFLNKLLEEYKKNIEKK